MAGRIEPAIGYWQKAGQNAIYRFANAEAVYHLHKAQDLLQQLPETAARMHQELSLCMDLSMAIVTLKGQGDSEAANVYRRARELCRQVGETPQLIPVLWGLCRFYFARAEFDVAYELAEQIMRYAVSLNSAALRLEAHRGLGATLFCLGDFLRVPHHLEQGIALYDPDQHQSHAFLYGQDPNVVCRTYLAWALWYLGYPDQALRCSQEAVTYARRLSHLPTLAFALNGVAGVHQLRGELRATREQAEAAIGLSTERDFILFVALGTILTGWVQGMQDEVESGIAQIHQALMTCHNIGVKLFRSYFLFLLAEVYGRSGQAQAGLEVLDEALANMEQTGERFCEAELYRLKGDLLLLQSSDNQLEAESLLRWALDRAHDQQSKSLELRTAMSFARLWQSQGKHQEAVDLLTPVYAWFTEGFDTADLIEAKQLLNQLNSDSHPPTASN